MPRNFLFPLIHFLKIVSSNYTADVDIVNFLIFFNQIISRSAKDNFSKLKVSACHQDSTLLSSFTRGMSNA